MTQDETGCPFPPAAPAPLRRRSLLALAGACLAAPVAGRAQPGQALPVIGYLGPETPELFASRLDAFREGLAETGHAEGRTVAIEYRWAEGRYDRLPALAADLAARRPAVLVAAGGAPVALAAKAATTTIPVVFEMGGDPVALGVVASLSRPEGNLTGVSSLSVEASLKRLELLHEVVAGADAFAAVVNPGSPTTPGQLRGLRAVADAAGTRLRVLRAGTEAELAAAFEAAARQRVDGLVFASDPFFAFRSGFLAMLAAVHGMPAITQSRDFALAGGLMSYGGDFMQSHRQAGVHAGRILKGERPADLPVQRVTRLEMFVNLTAASRLGLVLPETLLGRADEVLD